jgi:hypothetical protein
MIGIFMNTMADTDTFKVLFDNVAFSHYFENPTRAEVIKVLEENPTETLLCLGHGSPRGLFADGMEGYLIDSTMRNLLKDREIIGIWCYASDFARMNNLKGFFTYMFISNEGEARFHRCGGDNIDDDIIFNENVKFAELIKDFINNETPMEEWVETLYEGCNHDLPFVEFNYSNLSYFDGENNYVPRVLLEEEDDWMDNDGFYQPSLPFSYEDDITYNNPIGHCHFAKRDRVEEYLYENSGMNLQVSVDTLTDEEFYDLADYDYTLEEYTFAFNNGKTPNQDDYYMRIIYY